jgi:hypothetical protein
MSITPLASQSAQPIAVPTSVTQASANTTQTSASSKNNPDADQKQNADTGSQAKNANQASSSGVNLNDPEVIKVISQLEARDREVRIHEQAHVAAGGQYVTSGPSYSYQTGPDGKRYAVGGNVGIDVSPIPDDPEATIAKARQVIQAALAPAEPSSQDYAVAQTAQAMMQQAQQEVSSQQQQAMSGEDGKPGQSASIAKASAEESQNSSGYERVASRLYKQTEIATNALVGRVGGYQDSALRLGLSFQA